MGRSKLVKFMKDIVYPRGAHSPKPAYVFPKLLRHTYFGIEFIAVLVSSTDTLGTYRYGTIDNGMAYKINIPTRKVHAILVGFEISKLTMQELFAAFKRAK